MIDSELSKCDPRTDYMPNIGIFDELYVRSPEWRVVLRHYHWRGRRQSTIWDVFDILVTRDYIYLSCLNSVDLHGYSRDTQVVSQLLSCFTFCRMDEKLTIPLHPDG